MESQKSVPRLLCHLDARRARSSRRVFDTGGCDPRSDGKPSSRLCRLGRTQPSGGRGSSHLSTYHRPTGTIRRQGGPRDFHVWILIEHDHFRRRCGHLFRKNAGARAFEFPPKLHATGRHPTTRSRRFRTRLGLSILPRCRSHESGEWWL